MLDLERDLRVNAIAGHPIVLDLRLELLDVDGGDAAQTLARIIYRLLGGGLSALGRLGKKFDHFLCRHDRHS